MAGTGGAKPSSAPGGDSFARALTFVHRNLAKTADEAREIEAGLVVRTPSLPVVWAVNQVRVGLPLGFASLVELAEEQLAGSAYLQIVVENQDSGPELEEQFRAAGWKTERELYMVLSAEPDRVPDMSVVVDAREDETLEIMRRWFGEHESRPGALAALVEYSRREARACADRLLGVRSSDDQLVAITKLRGDGSTAQVEDVYTVPEARARGYARALVSHAAELGRDGGHDLIFITADDEDWPKQLYAGVGFRPLGRVWQFHMG
jgi:GNAT superfamily N-acetyltransferase